jgi:tetratricopeptide (TPR) repeat protein
MEYKKAHRPLPDIARALAVDGILEGSVERSGTRVHINAQLIYAPTDRHLWAESYDRDVSDVGALQSELARNIAKQVGLTAAATPTPKHIVNPEAHDAYLMGRYYWGGDQPERGREYFLKAIQLQPDYAAAYAALADAYGAPVAGGAPKAELQEAATKVEAAARRALVLDDSIAETHTTMAAFYALFAWNLAAADRESARAVELNPSFALAHHKRSRILFALGRNEEGLQEERAAMEIDPRVQPSGLGEALFHARQYDAAISELRARADVQPDDDAVHVILADVYWQKGMAAEFAHELARSYVPKSAAELETAFRHGGARAVTEWELAHVKRLQAKGYMSPLRLAMVCARTGRKEETLRYLEQAYEEHVPWLAFVGVEPDLDFIRSEPRFQAIAKKMGWPLVT